VFFAFIAGAPYVMVVVLERQPLDYGLWFMIVSLGYMLGNFLSGRYSQRFGTDRMVTIGNAFTLAAGLAGLRGAGRGDLAGHLVRADAVRRAGQRPHHSQRHGRRDQRQGLDGRHRGGTCGLPADGHRRRLGPARGILAPFAVLQALTHWRSGRGVGRARTWPCLPALGCDGERRRAAWRRGFVPRMPGATGAGPPGPGVGHGPRLSFGPSAMVVCSATAIVPPRQCGRIPIMGNSGSGKFVCDMLYAPLLLVTGIMKSINAQ
jgi:hypothetical protein